MLALILQPLQAQHGDYSFRMLPVLQYVYFDTAAATIPSRYIQFADVSEAIGFSVDSLRTIHNVHHSYLNLLGSRMRTNPASIVRLTGQVAWDVPAEKDTGLARQRANAVKEYLVRVWQIEPVRIIADIEKYPLKNIVAQEFRRVKVTTESWELYKPVLNLQRQSSSNREYYTLLDFRYNSSDMGKQNERIVAEFIAPRMGPGRIVTITGFVDRDGLEDRNNKLGEHRAKATREVIRKLSKVEPDTFIVRSAPDHVGGDRPAEDFMIARRVEVVIESR